MWNGGGGMGDGDRTTRRDDGGRPRRWRGVTGKAKRSMKGREHWITLRSARRSLVCCSWNREGASTRGDAGSSAEGRKGGLDGSVTRCFGFRHRRTRTRRREKREIREDRPCVGSTFEIAFGWLQRAPSRPSCIHHVF